MKFTRINGHGGQREREFSVSLGLLGGDECQFTRIMEDYKNGVLKGVNGWLW